MSDLPIEPDKLVGLAQSSFTAPDLFQAVEGWRTWRVSQKIPRYGVTPKMYSVTERDYFWAPRQAMRAECFWCADLPGDLCHCGFYSAKDLDHLLSMSYHIYNAENPEVRVLGRLANWGKVIECSQGWRAEWAYPVELFVPFECWRLAKPLGKAYGVKVGLMNFLKPGQALR